MDRNISSQMPSNSSQSKSLPSLPDPSVNGRQNNRNHWSRRRNDSNNKNSIKNHSIVNQTAGHSGRQSSHSRGGRPRGSGSLANGVDCDLWSDHLSDRSSDVLSDKFENKKSFGPKKHNLNHLLNFTFDSRDHIFNDQRAHSRGQQRFGRHSSHRYNKEHFLQANCQFVVNDRNDYSIHGLDPDVSVDWNSVEEIRFNSLTAETYCPICLDTPVAPKITRCGHIYCWSCVLHYLALSDHKWRKCPICFDSIQSEDLRSVSSVNKIDYKSEDFITLCLMKRKKGSTIASPAVLYDNNQNCLHQKFEPLNGDPVISSYQKILIASPNQVLNDVIGRERNQLMTQLIADKETPEVCFIENALEKLKLREESLCKLCQQLETTPPVVDENTEKDPNEEFYYFYQSSDGQHIYLHSLNVRILKQEFGSLERCPQEITAKIVETEWESMSEDLRKRHRYLQHLPLTCEFRIVELEFGLDLISEPTLNLFRNEVIRRQKSRSKRAREERRRERHIEVEQNKRIHGIYPLPKYRLDNLNQFPSCVGVSDAVRSPYNSSESSTTLEDFPLTNQSTDSLSTACGTSPPIEAEFPSFAAMLREGKAKPMVGQKSKPMKVINELPTNDSEDEYQPPVYSYSLSDALAAALELKSCDQKQNDCEDKKSGSNKKKKKNKPKLLMSTGMNRMY